MSKLMFLIRGLPGSGKSTLTEGLVDHLEETLECKSTGVPIDIAVCSTDDIVTAGDVYLWSPAYIKQSHELNQMKVREACSRSIPVIVDNTNTTWREIEPYWLIAKKFGYKFEIKEPQTPWAFDVDICAKYNTHNVPKETIQRMLDRWESTASILGKIENQ